MTHQMFSYTCDDIRKLTYDKRRNVLSTEDASRFELHLEHCQTCSDYVIRTVEMLDSADEMDYGSKVDRDDLFGSIMKALDDGEKVEPFIPILVGDEDELPMGRKYSKPLLYSFLGIVVIFIVGFSFTALPRFSDKREISLASTIPAPIGKEGTQKEGTEVKKIQQSRLGGLTLQPSPAHAENLNIFGDSQAEWKVDGGRAQHFELKEGTVLIEYIPNDRSSSLTLQTSDFKIQVLGTIFYASKENQVVGVIAGKIRLQTQDGESVILERGQEYEPKTGVKNSAPQVLVESEKFVDVQRHHQLLSKVPKAKKTRKKTRVAILKKRDLRKEADLAISKGDYKIAAQIMERMVNELPASAPENATLKLDLARVYIKKLKQPRRAFGHLKAFTKQRPFDAATPTAKDEMCRISKRFKLHDREACQE